jgi:hypothetical protein
MRIGSAAPAGRASAAARRTKTPHHVPKRVAIGILIA